MRHPLLVDRHGDRCGTIARHQRQDAVDLCAAPTLERDRIDHCPARVDLQRCLEHLGLGGVDHQRQLDVHRQLLEQPDHLILLVGALGHRHAHIEQVRTAIDLLARDLQCAVVIVLQQQALDLARAKRVDPLADHRWRRLLAQCHRLDTR